MTIYQALRQLEYLADALTWPTSSKRIFANESVVYSALPWRMLMQHLRWPWCVFSLISATNHPETQGIVNVTFRAAIGAKQENDRYGRMVLTGGRQAATTEDSDNKGLLQLKTKLTNELSQLTQANGILFGVRETAMGVGGGEVENQPAAVIEVDYQAIVWDGAHHYPDVYNLAGAQDGSDVDLTWSEDPPARFDRISTDGIIVCRKTGSNPTGPTDGALGTVDIGAKEYTDTAPGAGTYYYGVFAAYDETNETPATAESYSDGKFVTVVVS